MAKRITKVYQLSAPRCVVYLLGYILSFEVGAEKVCLSAREPIDFSSQLLQARHPPRHGIFRFFQVLAIFLLLLLFQLVLLANRKSACFHGFDFVMLTNHSHFAQHTLGRRDEQRSCCVVIAGIMH